MKRKLWRESHRRKSPEVEESGEKLERLGLSTSMAYLIMVPSFIDRCESFPRLTTHPNDRH